MPRAFLIKKSNCDNHGNLQSGSYPSTYTLLEPNEKRFGGVSVPPKPVQINSDQNHTGDELSSIIFKELPWPPKHVLFSMETYCTEHDTTEVDRKSPTKPTLFLSEKPSTKKEGTLGTESKLAKETYSKVVFSKQFPLMANQRGSSITGLYSNCKDEEKEIYFIQQQRTPKQWRSEISLTLEELDNACKTAPSYVEVSTGAYISKKQSFSSKSVENDVCLPNANFTSDHQQLTHHDHCAWKFSSSIGADKESRRIQSNASSTDGMEMKKNREARNSSMNSLFDDAVKRENKLGTLDLEQRKDCCYTCSECGQSFGNLNMLIIHKQIHTGDKLFQCSTCSRVFRQQGNLARHRLTHSTLKPFVCSQCSKSFNRASNLQTHLRTHTNIKPFICDFCGKGFHQKIDMKIHRYTHTGEKPHKCLKCGRGFKQLTHLTYHMRTHSEFRMYHCQYCGKGFNQKGNLKAHIYGHTGERPFKCDFCGKGFTLASTLNTHKRTHAPKKPFECQYCRKSFYQKNALKTHYLTSHPYTGENSLLKP